MMWSNILEEAMNPRTWVEAALVVITMLAVICAGDIFAAVCR